MKIKKIELNTQTEYIHVQQKIKGHNYEPDNNCDHPCTYDFSFVWEGGNVKTTKIVCCKSDLSHLTCDVSF